MLFSDQIGKIIFSPFEITNLWRYRSRLLTAKPNHRLGRAPFYSKTGFGSRTAKSQPIWIKLCTHLLLYGTYTGGGGDLDRDRREGDSRPVQNEYFFVILVTHPIISHIKTTDRRDFGGKPSKWRCRTVHAIVKNSGTL